MLALPLAFAACNETPEEVKPIPEDKAPVLTLTSEAILEFGEEGGNGTITYTLVNPVEGTELTATCEADWVVDLAVAETITFAVVENELEEARETKVVVAYGDQSFEVTVKQTAIEAPDTVTFEANYIYGEYDYYGDEGGNYVFYLSDNGFVDGDDPLPNSTYYCLDIYGVKVEGESNGYVTIPAGEYHFVNEDNGLVGSMTGPYSYLLKTGDYTSADEDIESEVYMFEDAVLVVTADGIELVAVIEGVEHYVTYTGSLEINDCREPAEEVETKNFVAEHAMANYMGDYYNPGVADNFMVVLSDLGWDDEGWELPNAAYYVLDLYTEIVDGELAIPYGTYALDMTDSCEPNTLSASSTRYILLDEYGWDYVAEAYFVAGSVTVDANGIVAELEDYDGAIHKVAYKGAVTNIVDYSDEFGGGGGDDEILSTLWEDWYCNFSNCVLEYTWYGDYYEVGIDDWLLYLNPTEEVGDGLQLDLLSNDVGLYELSGEYVISNSLEKFTGYPGYENGGYMEGCWYFNADLSQYAPLVEGDIYITNNGDTTFTIEVDAYDDAGNNIYGSWTGVDANQVETFKCESIVVNNHGMKNRAFSPAAMAMRKR